MLHPAQVNTAKRFGFPLWPNFGGNLHCYVGTTLDAAIVDLLPISRSVRVMDVPAACLDCELRPCNYPQHTVRTGTLPCLVFDAQKPSYWLNHLTRSSFNRVPLSDHMYLPEFYTET